MPDSLKKMITVFDPSLANNDGEPSKNLGDEIIWLSVCKVLKELFPSSGFQRISTHEIPPNSLLKKAGQTNGIFVGGSNLLSSYVRGYNQWKLMPPGWKGVFFPKIKNAILLGVGWWQYQEPPSLSTKFYYNRVLNHKVMHSVRDSFTLQQMQSLGFKNVVNTGCPTTWELNGISGARKNPGINNCIFTLTDYNKKPELDIQLLEIISKNFSELAFFSQGSRDLEYLKHLPSFEKVSDKLKILTTVEAFQEALSKPICYIGTRLHGGIFALQKKKDALIIGIDNRAKEMKKDINLPVVDRADKEGISSWIKGNYKEDLIKINLNSINTWKQSVINNIKP